MSRGRPFPVVRALTGDAGRGSGPSATGPQLHSREWTDVNEALTFYGNMRTKNGKVSALAAPPPPAALSTRARWRAHASAPPGLVTTGAATLGRA